MCGHRDLNCDVYAVVVLVDMYSGFVGCFLFLSYYLLFSFWLAHFDSENKNQISGELRFLMIVH